MSWLSELTWSNRDEHIDAMLTGDAELDESVVSTYDRPQGFKFKLAQRLAAGLLPAVGASDKGKTLQTNETTGAPEWAEASGGGVLMVTDTDGTLDKTMGEIQTAFMRGTPVIIANGGVDNLYFTIAELQGVREGKGEYIGYVLASRSDGEGNLIYKLYGVTSETEQGALSAYPSYAP